MRTIIVAFLLLHGATLFAAPKAPAKSAASAPPRATVEALLSGYDRPPGVEQIRELGARADETIIAVADDGAVALPVRLRAVSALAHTPTARARAYLRERITGLSAAKTPEERAVLRKAALALGWQGGNDVVAVLRPLVAHDDREVRLDAVIALGLTKHPDALAVFDRRLEEESDPIITRQLAKQARALRAVLPPPPRPAPPPTALPPPRSTDDFRPRAGSGR